MKPEGLQALATGPYREPVESSPLSHIIILSDPLKYYPARRSYALSPPSAVHFIIIFHLITQKTVSEEHK